MNDGAKNEAQTKLLRGQLELIVLRLLRKRPMHGYKIITTVRKEFNAYFGPSTIYPMLNEFEKKGYVEGTWDLEAERPRKIYELTSEGRKLSKALMNCSECIRLKLIEYGKNDLELAELIAPLQQ